MINLGLYFHTLRYLQPRQICGRALRRFINPQPDKGPPPGLRAATGPWREPARRMPSMVGPRTFRFLNDVRALDGDDPWNDPGATRLWKYNLHYFDDLNAKDSCARLAWHNGLINSWIKENTVGMGTGWEPFPTSLRIVNWLKWSLGGRALPDGALHSLAVQSRYLMKRLETDQGGNHLIANAKALVFAGTVFHGEEADAWRREGARILQREIPFQTLSDGGHFERSPMYHSIVLEDILDLFNLNAAFPDANADLPGMLQLYEHTAHRMRVWLKTMCHPDGQIALFNDAAFAIAPAPDELEAYAENLGLGTVEIPAGHIVDLAHTGYVRLQSRDAVILLDVGDVGPDFLPGHGHADTLSFEMSLFGQRLVVDPGVSTYEQCAQRAIERGTASHNTVAVDRENSSEVWGSFRVARRARPFNRIVTESDDMVVVGCSHDGYRRLPGRVSHRRTWTLRPGSLVIKDELAGGFHEARSTLLLHPEIARESGLFSDRQVGLRKGEWSLKGGRKVSWRCDGGEWAYQNADYHQEFGASEATMCLTGHSGGRQLVFTITWL